ncbi:unnamed protein product [Cochlearia groenlandica]
MSTTMNHQLPPLPRDSSSVPSSSSVRCETGFKMRKLNHDGEEDNPKQIDLNIINVNKLVSKPEAGLVLYSPEPKSEEETKRISAKDELYKLCGVRHWKAPLYECCDEEGPSNMRSFVFKATVEIKEDSRVSVLECFGDPQHKKKMAAEQAAEAALWYLKNVGHALEREKASGRRRQPKTASEDGGNKNQSS